MKNNYRKIAKIFILPVIVTGFIFVYCTYAYTASTQLTIQAIYPTAGSFTWTAPAGVTSVNVECWGGGAGGVATDMSYATPAGGGGAYSKKNSISVTSTTGYTVVVGAAGLGGIIYGRSPTAGGDSYFKDTSTVLARGGSLNVGDTGGAGGSAASGVGDTKYSGGNGANGGGWEGPVFGGGGGGSSAGTGANGNNGSGGDEWGNGGSGGSAPIGGGAGANGGNADNNGFSATQVGGAGGGGGGYTWPGGNKTNGGDGYQGKVVISYTIDITKIKISHGTIKIKHGTIRIK